jgi:G:T-mismatch repair DNA endonuclease (very short patch repair protein)
VVFPARRRIIEIRGCFWHRHPGCKCASTPATRWEYWQTKFATNVARDMRNLAVLHAAGWSVLVVWECEVANPSLAERLTEFLGPPGRNTRSRDISGRSTRVVSQLEPPAQLFRGHGSRCSSDR